MFFCVFVYDITWFKKIQLRCRKVWVCYICLYLCRFDVEQFSNFPVHLIEQLNKHWLVWPKKRILTKKTKNRKLKMKYILFILYWKWSLSTLETLLKKAYSSSVLYQNFLADLYGFFLCEKSFIHQINCQGKELEQ